MAFRLLSLFTDTVVQDPIRQLKLCVKQQSSVTLIANLGRVTYSSSLRINLLLLGTMQMRFVRVLEAANCAGRRVHILDDAKLSEDSEDSMKF